MDELYTDTLYHIFPAHSYYYRILEHGQRMAVYIQSFNSLMKRLGRPVRVMCTTSLNRFTYTHAFLQLLTAISKFRTKSNLRLELLKKSKMATVAHFPRLLNTVLPLYGRYYLTNQNENRRLETGQVNLN